MCSANFGIRNSEFRIRNCEVVYRNEKWAIWAIVTSSRPGKSRCMLSSANYVTREIIYSQALLGAWKSVVSFTTSDLVPVVTFSAHALNSMRICMQLRTSLYKIWDKNENDSYFSLKFTHSLLITGTLSLGTKFNRHRINIDSTLWRWINVDSTWCASWACTSYMY